MDNYSHETVKEPSDILIVDDNPKNIQVLASVLNKNEYSISFALNGKQALEVLERTDQIDLILMDVNMPVMDGFETTKAIRQKKIYQDIPIIFLTALNEMENMISGFETGGQDYITKPFNSQELLARVKTHLELKHSKDKLRNINAWLDKTVQERTRELHQAHEKLKEAYNELESLDQAKTEFLRLVSHEINTPLNGIMGFTNILKKKLKSTEFSRYIELLDRSVKRLIRFAKTSLYITMLRTDGEEVEKENVKLHQLVNSVIQSLTSKVEEKNLEIKVKNNSSPPCVYGNSEFLGYCLESVLINAAHFSPENGSITVSMDTMNDNIICSVVDQGTGFSQSALNNLFKIFSTSREHVDENKGLDLALAKLIMDAHQGQIHVLNNTNNGATVRLIFPRCNSNNSEEAEASLVNNDVN